MQDHDKRATLCQVKTEARRKYELRERAERQEETRRRIVQATEDLHSTVGPARTTVVDIARLAGVSRPTVYSHFPGERELFAACGRHWIDANPRPVPGDWAPVAEPEQRVRRALEEVYGYYAPREQVLANITRDVPLMPALEEVFGAIQGPWMSEAVAVLSAGRCAPGKTKRLLHAAIAHALDFRTWRMLVREQGLSQAEAVDVMACLVGCAAG
jgi:AcrR family transcriptional regulator